MADILYAVDGYTDAGYFVYTADAGAGLTARSFVPNDAYVVIDYAVSGYFTVPELNATKIKGSAVSLTVVASTAVTSVRRRPGTAALTSSFDLSAQGRFAQKGQADISSSVLLSAQAGTIKPASASLTAFDTVAVTALANKNFTAALTAQATLTAQASVTKDAGYPTATVTWDSQDSSWDDWQHQYWDPDNGIWIKTTSTLYAFPVVSGNTQFLLPSEFSIYPNGGYRLTGSATLVEDNSLLFAIGGYEKTTGATVTSSTSVVAQGGRGHSTASATIASTVGVTITADVIPPTRGTADLASAFVQSTTPGFVKTAGASLASNFSIFAQGKIPGIQLGSAGIASQFNQSSTANFRAGAGVVSQVTATSSATSTRTRPGASNQLANFTISGTSTRTRPGVVADQAQFTVSATGINVRPGSAQLQSLVSLTALGGPLRFISSQMTGQAEVQALAVRRRNTSATLSAAGFVLTAGDVFTIDPDFQLVVPPETRYYPVLADIRLLNMPQETRVNIILPEARDILVPEETRQEFIL